MARSGGAPGALGQRVGRKSRALVGRFCSASTRECLETFDMNGNDSDYGPVK